MPGLTEPLRKKIEASKSLMKLRERMLEREGKSESTLARYLNGVFSFSEFLKCKDPLFAGTNGEALKPGPAGIQSKYPCSFL